MGNGVFLVGFLQFVAAFSYCPKIVIEFQTDFSHNNKIIKVFQAIFLVPVLVLEFLLHILMVIMQLIFLIPVLNLIAIPFILSYGFLSLVVGIIGNFYRINGFLSYYNKRLAEIIDELNKEDI